jgi:hypothetical protein
MMHGQKKPQIPVYITYEVTAKNVEHVIKSYKTSVDVSLPGSCHAAKLESLLEGFDRQGRYLGHEAKNKYLFEVCSVS